MRVWHRRVLEQFLQEKRHVHWRCSHLSVWLRKVWDQDVNECASNSCINACALGFTGLNGELKPCLNQGNFIDGVNFWACNYKNTCFEEVNIARVHPVSTVEFVWSNPTRPWTIGGCVLIKPIIKFQQEFNYANASG